MSTTEVLSPDEIKNSGVKIEEIGSERFVMLRVYSMQVFALWDKFKEALVESVAFFKDLTEIDLVRIQHLMMSGRLQGLVLVDQLDKSNPKVLIACVYSINKDQVFGNVTANVHAFKVFENVPLEAWNKTVARTFNIFREDGAGQITTIVTHPKIAALLKKEGFDMSHTLAVLKIGVS